MCASAQKSEKPALRTQPASAAFRPLLPLVAAPGPSGPNSVHVSRRLRVLFPIPQAGCTEETGDSGAPSQCSTHELQPRNKRPRCWFWLPSPKAAQQMLLRKEVIQPHLPVRLPCYDLVLITNPTFDSSLLAVGPLASGVTDFHDLTGGVYKARERIHRGVADPRLLATPTS
jgi:hypothetical protein